MNKKKKIPRHAGLVPLLTAEQVTSHLGISLRTLYRYINSGRLTAYKLDGMLRINPEDLKLFLSKRALRAGKPAPFVELPVKELPALNPAKYRVLTDVEAQQFFHGIERDEEGNLVSNPDSD